MDKNSPDPIYRDLLSHCRAYGTRLLGWEVECGTKGRAAFFLQVTYADGQHGIVVMAFTHEAAVRSLYQRMLARFHAYPGLYQRDQMEWGRI